MSASGDGYGHGGDEGKPSAHPPALNHPAPAHPAPAHPPAHNDSGQGHAHGGPVLFAPPGSGSHMIISGPAIVQTQPTGWGGPHCPTCTCGKPPEPHGAHGHDHDELDLIPNRWNVPQHIYDELVQLCRMVKAGDAPIATIGGAQAVLRELLGTLSEQMRDVAAPKKAEAKGCLGQFADLFSDGPARKPEPPEKPTPLNLLEEACDKGFITAPMLAAARRLPLDAASDLKGGAAKGRPFVRFLVELADMIYAQPARMS